MGGALERRWIRLEIPGFDDLLANGIPRGVNVLIAGGPGSGKTLFCLQALYNAARRGERCLYITMEEPPKRLRMHMESFGWDVEPISANREHQRLRVGDGRLYIERHDPILSARAVEALLARAAGELSIKLDVRSKLIPKDFDPFMLALDSISALESAFTGRPESYRIYIEQLFRMLEEIDVTSFLIAETEEAPVRFSRTGVEEFLADGVFVFYNLKIRDTRVRALEILKLRGAKHERRLVPMDITDSGIVVYPRERIYGVEEIR
jgi:circadian clock protein KaiC